jgi:hypothetical protein
MAVRAFRFLKACYALDALRSQEIKVSRFEDLNDPFELYGIHLGNREHRAKFREWKDWVSQRQAVLCFSRRWRNPLLWSHYGDRHRGVAIEFQIDPDLVQQVRYSPYRLHINIERALERGWFSKADAERAALTKAAHWKYEEEVRVIFDLPKCRHRAGMLFEPLTSQIRIVGVTLGPLCTLSENDVQQALPTGKRLTVTWSRLAFTSFDVVRQKLRKQIVLRGK